MSAREAPVAICPVCGAVAYSPLRINAPCKKQYDGKPCRGTMASAVDRSDWEECPACQGQGRLNDDTCFFCAGIGWRFLRTL